METSRDTENPELRIMGSHIFLRDLESDDIPGHVPGNVKESCVLFEQYSETRTTPRKYALYYKISIFC